MVETNATRLDPDQSLGPELGAQRFLRVMQVRGHHVFEQNTETSFCGSQGQPATQRAGSDNGDGDQWLYYLTASDLITSSAFGLEWLK